MEFSRVLLGSISVTTGTVVNTSVTDWNGTVTPINDTGNVSLTLATLARAAGETVTAPGPTYLVSSGTFNAPGGTAGGNYVGGALDISNTPNLAITTATLTGVLTSPNQTKVYGSDDPALATVGVTLTGLVNNPAISTWNGAVSVNDSALTSTAATLARQVGENVGTHNVTAGTFTDPSANYSTTALGLGNTPNLAITTATLTGVLTSPNQTKMYGSDDPALATVGVTLTGLVNNPAISTWNGAVSVNDSALTSTAATLVRQVGENVGTHNVTAGTFTDPSANYSTTALGLGNTPNLAITQNPITVTAQTDTKVYDGNTSSVVAPVITPGLVNRTDRKSTRLNSSHTVISY